MSSFNFIAKLRNLVSVCLCCGSSIRSIFNYTKWTFADDSDDSILCQFCLQQLLRTENTESLQNYFCTTYSLFSWQEEGTLRNIIYGLKGCGQPKIYNFFVDRMLRNRFYNSDRYLNKEIIIVPAPSREHNKADHAYGFGQALSQRLNVGFYPILIRQDLSEQKSVGENDRWQNVEQKIRTTCALTEGEQLDKIIVFVDDLITSGATAYSAYVALQKPQNFEVCTIFFRPRLRAL